MPRRESRENWDIPELVEWREEDARLAENRCLPLAAIFIGVAALCWPRRNCWPRASCSPYACSPTYVCWPRTCYPRPCLPL